MQKAGRFLPYGLGVRIATVFVPTFYGRVPLSRWNVRGYISPKARISHKNLTMGTRCHLDDEVLIYEDHGGGTVEFGNSVHLHYGVFVQTGVGGSVSIGDASHLQPRCQISAYGGSVEIGQEAEIAPACAFYPYDHATEPGTAIRKQPVVSRGGIRIGNRVWLGYGVIVLDGVRIGDDAVIGAGSVVTRDVPPSAIAVGNPARVLRSR